MWMKNYIKENNKIEEIYFSSILYLTNDKYASIIDMF